jgi:carboxypeptidase C (cathepsin A)
MAMQWSHADEPKGVPAYAPGVPDSGSDTGTRAPVPLISPLHRAMELNPSLRVLLMTGMYDGAAGRLGCDFATYTVSQIDASLRARVDARCYPGGHMMYTDKQAREDMKRDMAALVRGGSAGVAARTPR